MRKLQKSRIMSVCIISSMLLETFAISPVLAGVRASISVEDQVEDRNVAYTNISYANNQKISLSDISNEISNEKRIMDNTSLDSVKIAKAPSESSSKKGDSNENKDSSKDSSSKDGKDEQAQSTKKAPKTPSTVKVAFDFVDYDLSELTKRIAEMTGKNFILTDSSLSGKKVTIISPTKVSIDEAYQVYLSVLKTNGYTVAPLGKSLKIVPLDKATAEPIPIFLGTDSGKGEGFVTRLVRLKNVDAEQITGALSRMVTPSGSMLSYAPTNSLIITDTATNISRILEIIQKLDVESPVEQLVIVPIKYALAVDIAEKITSVFGDETQATGKNSSKPTTRPSNNQPKQPKNNKAEAGAQAPSSAGTGSYGSETPKISKIISDERTNSLIILATEKSLEDIKALISKLDVDVNENMKSDIHVMYLKYAKAEDLAGTLANLAGTGSSSVSSSRSQSNRNTSSNSGTGNSNSRNNRNNSSNNSSRNSSNNMMSGGLGGSFGGSSGSANSPVAMFEGGLRITADPPTNALVITSSYNDFQTLKKVIEKLDVRRKQVFVEAVILEISQNRDRNLGLSYHGGIPGLEGSGTLLSRGSKSLLLDPNILSGLAVGVFGSLVDAPSTVASAMSGGKSTSMQIPAFGVVMEALQTDSDVNVLSTPSILTANNQEAKIVVGQNIPFKSGTTLSAVGQNVSITREDVALTLKVTPQVNESNEVTFELFQEITEVMSQGELGPTTTKRQADTVVSVPDNQTVVIGGLISTSDSVSEDKIPILGDIPLIGALFRNKKKTLKKTNLLIFLTPHIIETEEDLQNVYRIKMAQRQEFLRRFYGKSQSEQMKEMEELMKYSMNLPGVPPTYPNHQNLRPQDSTIEIKGGVRGFIAPIPGADKNTEGPIIVPVFSDSQQDKQKDSAKDPKKTEDKENSKSDSKSDDKIETDTKAKTETSSLLLLPDDVKKDDIPDNASVAKLEPNIDSLK